MPETGRETTIEPVAARSTADDAVLSLLRTWAPGQRWFPAKGTTGALDRVAVLTLADPLEEAEVTIHLLRLPGGGLLQVPVTIRPERGDDDHGDEDGNDASGDRSATSRLPGPELIGRLDDGRLLLDGCHDPAFVRAWLAAAQREPNGSDDSTGCASSDLHTAVLGMRVLTGEQSNTSVLLPHADPPAILKVFRGVGTGPNPDVDVPLALTRVGWHGVPQPIAWLTGSWPGEAGGAPLVGHLGVLSELVAESEDGFELACRYAAQGRDFSALAEDLGRRTAQMHRALRTALPIATAEAGSPRPDATTTENPTVVAMLRRRAAAAITSAPVLGERVTAIERVLAAVDRVGTLPPLQRVHGDYHLGQVLRSPHRGWSVLDFEGEPQAAADERIRPDLALRDLAGMLRSIDYAAAVGNATSALWALGARSALVNGYRAEAAHDSADPDTAGPDPDVLLRALELDKALYEVVYESRNRPSWLQIPLDGVDRLLAGVL